MMKKYLLSVLTILFLLPSFAQELKELRLVGNPKKLSSGEMVARRDQNGNYCAAIQVVSDMDGFSYDSWDGIVGDVDKKPGKDMVFLTSSERVLEIFKTGYSPLKVILADVGINLQEKDVWQIKIAGDETAAVLPVTFRFTPEDSKLFIDGKSAGSKLTQNLSVGQHQIRLERDGYQTKDETITVNEEKVFFEWELADAPDAGLQITTTPAGASIYLDGVKLGESPVAAFYAPGTYPIKVTKEGYISIEDETLEVKLPQTSKSYTLEENMGYLTVNTREGTTVYFNDEVVADPTRVKLPPQLIRVKVSMPKAEDLEEQVVLKKDDDKVLNMYPDIQTGTLQIAVTPFDAEIELTGDAGEHYTAQGMKIFDEIPVGTYTIKVIADGHKTTEETVALSPNDKVNKSIALEEGSDFEIFYGIEMVFVKGGTFTMGCTSEQSNCGDDEKPAHEVTVSDFYIGKYEVTQKQWREVMGANPSHFKNCDNCPVENVSWNDVQEFIKKLNQQTGKKYRLPTEAEWEYAARGGTMRNYYKYAGSDNIKEVAWCDKNSGSKTHAIGQKKPNELGIYDITGNVWEWCSDWYSSDYYQNNSQNNPQGPSFGSGRVYRGGSCVSHSHAGLFHLAYRGFYSPGYSFSSIGFRLVVVP